EFKDVRDRIIVVGSIGMKAKQNKDKDKDEDDQTDPDTCDEEEQSDPDEREYYYSEFSCYGDRVDIVAPGENIFSTVEPLSAKYKDRNGNGYRFKNGTSMAAPQVAGVAGMIYSIRPDLTASRVKEIIIESAKNSAKSEGNREITHIQYDKNGKPINPNTYYVLDAEAALKKAMDEGNGDEPDEKDNAIIYGKVTDKNGEPVNNAKIYATSETTKKIFEFYSDEEGDYLLSLPPDTYTITFVGDEVIIDKVVFNGHGWTNKGTSYYATDSMKIKAKEVYPLDVQLDSYSYKEISVLGRTGNGELEYLYNVQIDIVKNATFTNTINEKIYYTNLEDGDYYIKAYKAGYIPQTLSVKVINGIICDNGRNKLTEIVLEPVKKSTISGSVLLYNETTYDVSPIENQSIFIYKCDSGDPSVMKYSSSDPYLVCTTTTNSKGIYEVEVEGTGEYIIKFDEDKQETVYANGNKYTVNACYIINGDDDDGNGNGNGDGNGGGDKDDGKVQLGLPGIIYDYWGRDGREDRFYTIYYCSSITITKPYPDEYQVYGVYNKTVSKGDVWDEEKITIYEPARSIAYGSEYTDGHTGSKDSFHKIVLGGTCFPDRRFPYDTTAGFMPLPEEVMEKLMAGEMVIFFVDENAPDGQPLQYAVVEHEYN
ncbi:MAG: S8 family serine peptidase, partial [Oscillospiraceae bacterium]|nr:S8 family serine peptidase [Oscillospiraceae bacterium]